MYMLTRDESACINAYLFAFRFPLGLGELNTVLLSLASLLSSWP